MAKAIQVENLSKQYRLGQIGTGSLVHDMNRWWHSLRGKEDPYLKIGEANDRATKGASDYVWSLRDVGFEIEQGDSVGIIGRNGAGKSTLLKILSRVTAPTTGSVKVKGRIASLLEVGTGFHPDLSGRDNIFLNGAILGMRKEEIARKFDEIVDFAGVERYIDTPVKRYSSGMYVRLAFAVAAHLESEILIVDEVLAVGDAEFQKKCLGKMGEVSKGEGRTILFVSHNISAVNTLCNKGIVLQNGFINSIGPIQDCINSYLQLGKSNKPSINFKNSDSDFELIDAKFYSDTKSGQHITSEPINFIIHYRILKEVTGLRIGFDLIESKTEAVIFRSFHDDQDASFSIFEEGKYVSKGNIPADLLSEGDYTIQLKVGIHNYRWIIYDQFNLELNIIKTEGINSNYNDSRPGIIMPKINWKTKQANEKETTQVLYK